VEQGQTRVTGRTRGRGIEVEKWNKGKREQTVQEEKEEQGKQEEKVEQWGTRGCYSILMLLIFRTT